MAKNKKKRNKVYTGVDAAITRPIVTRISAANRSQIGQYWFEHKKFLRPIIITALIVIAVIILILELVHVASGG
jgi:hypothetical protein